MTTPLEFASPQPFPRLQPGTIHVWQARLEPERADLAELAATLSADEHSRAARFHFARDRVRYQTARGVLRRLLGEYAGAAPEALVLRYGAKQKPAIDRPENARRIEFNVSHRGALALYAFALDREVGIDIEQLRDVPEALAIARNHFTPAETELLEQAAEHGAGRECFFRLWTRKEAVIKAVGTGLSMPLDEFDVSSGAPDALDAGSWRTVAVPARPECPWSLCDVNLEGDYRAALCVAGEPTEIAYWAAEPA